jgi:hypothetical protein
VSAERINALGANGFGGASNPRLVAAIAGDGWIDALDIVLVANGLGGEPQLVPRSDLRNHPRAEHATAVRTGAVTFGYAAADDHTLVPRDEVVVAACAPGNARALRAALSAGFEPVASVQLWRPQRS